MGLTGGKSRPHRDSIPDRPARSQSLYRIFEKVLFLFASTRFSQHVMYELPKTHSLFEDLRTVTWTDKDKADVLKKGS